MGGQQADTSLDEWLQAYVEEKGSPPRNALQLVAFAKHRGGLVRYSEALQLCHPMSDGGDDPLLNSRGEMSPRTMAAFQLEGNAGFDSEGRVLTAEGRQLTPRDWRLLRFGVSPPGKLPDGTLDASQAESEAPHCSEARRDRALSLDQARYRCDSPERQMQPARLRYFWTLPRAKVELLYSRRTGKKQVLVDGKALFKTFQQSFEWSWEDAESQVRIFLRSENGNHELFCEDLYGATLETSPRDPAAFAKEIARRGSSLPLSWREPEGATRAGAPRTPRGDRTGVPTVAASSSSARKPSPAEGRLWPGLESAEGSVEVPGSTPGSTFSAVSAGHSTPVAHSLPYRVGASAEVDAAGGMSLTGSTGSVGHATGLARPISGGQIAHRGGSKEPPLDTGSQSQRLLASIGSQSVASSTASTKEAVPSIPTAQPVRAQQSSPRPCESPRTPVGLGSRAASAPELGFDSCPVYGAATAAASASTAPVAAGSTTAVGTATATATAAMSRPSSSVTAAPTVPRLVLPAAGSQAPDPLSCSALSGGGSFSGKAGMAGPSGSAQTAATSQDGNAEGGWASPFTVQFRHSRSAPIFAKVKEYLSAARPSPPPRNAASAVVPATFRKHLPTKPTNHATRGAPLMGSQGSSVYSSGVGGSATIAAADTGRNLGRSAGAVLMTTAIAQARRQLESLTPPPAPADVPNVQRQRGNSPPEKVRAKAVPVPPTALPIKAEESRQAARMLRAKRSTGATANTSQVESVLGQNIKGSEGSRSVVSVSPPRHLEALPEDSQHHDGVGVEKGIGEGSVNYSSLVRTSSAPGKFQRPLGYRVEADMMDDELDNTEEVDLSGCQADHPQSSQVHMRPNPKTSARPSVPRISLEWSREVERGDVEGPNGCIKPAPGGKGKGGAAGDRVLWAPQQTQPKASAQALPQPSLFMLWTPRKNSSPRHEGHQKRIATPDAAKMAQTTPRPPPSLPTASPTGVPSWPLMQPMQSRSPVHPPPTSPTATSPTPSRPRQPTPQYSNVFTLGSNNAAPANGSRIIVPRVPGHTGTAHVAYAFAVDSSGSRSVGYPPPGERGYKPPGPPPSGTLPSAMAGYAL